jgi:hypothetical protein
MTDRTPDGKWKPGQSGNPNGRPCKTVEQEALDKFRAHFRNGNFETILTALQKQANKGNVRAIQLVFDYLVGKPAQAIDLQSSGEIKVTVEYTRAPDTTA